MDEMKPYVGTKIIKACKMDEVSFLQCVKGKGVLNQETRPGYRVQYSNPDGSTYDSWSPANVFERSYREVSDDERNIIN